MIYCDTSLLLALYVEGDAFHGQAFRLASHFKESIPFTMLAELELTNGVRRSLAARIIGRAEHDAIFRQIAEDESQGILSRHPLAQAEHFAKSRELSKQYTPELSSRSLDILHVAGALLLKATGFGSFDEKQRILASRAGLKVLPATIDKKKAAR